MSNPTLAELFELERHSTALRTLLQSYFDSERVVATLKVNRAATLGTGDARVECDFSQDFREALVAMAANDSDLERFCVAHGISP
jgi:hypothetical protein